VPFCVVKCGYCDFNSFAAEDDAAHDQYLTALAAELRLSLLPSQPYSVFFGGGTPSLLDPSRLRRLFDAVQEHLDLRQCREVTMEANPESLSGEKVRVALAAGITRISIGAQSFDPRRLRFLDRAHDGARTAAAVAEARAANCTNLSLDMMFGLPGQTLDEWREDLEKALDLGPDHLSCYHLTYEPGTRLHRDRKLGRIPANDDDVDRELFEWTRVRLQEAGFHAYEISNFAGRGGPCLHNDHYWLQGDYVGVGPGACGHRSGIRTTNLKPLDAWGDTVLAGQLPVASAEVLTPLQRAGEAIWLGLRRHEGVDLAQVEERIGLPVRERFAHVVQRQAAGRLVEHIGDRIRLTDQGIRWADQVGFDYLGS
jgi:oxygen-independent coproporphyrinogen-3 oxidase